MKLNESVKQINEADLYIATHRDHYLDIFILYAEVKYKKDCVPSEAKKYNDLFFLIFKQMICLTKQQKIDDIKLKKNIKKMQIILEDIIQIIKLSKHKRLDVVSGIVYLKLFIKMLNGNIFDDLLKSNLNLNSFHSSTNEQNILNFSNEMFELELDVSKNCKNKRDENGYDTIKLLKRKYENDFKTNYSEDTDFIPSSYVNKDPDLIILNHNEKKQNNLPCDKVYKHDKSKMILDKKCLSSSNCSETSESYVKKCKNPQIKLDLSNSDLSSLESSSYESLKKCKKNTNKKIICDTSGNNILCNNVNNLITNNKCKKFNNENDSSGSKINIPVVLTGTGNSTLLVNTTNISIDQILKIYSLKILKQIEGIEFVITQIIKILSEIKRNFLTKINCLEMYNTTSNLDLPEIEYHNNLLNTLYNQISIILLQTDADGNPIFNNINKTITITLNLGSGGIYELFTIDNIYAIYLSTQLEVIIGNGDYIFELFPNSITMSNAIKIYKNSFLNVKKAIFKLNENKKILCQWKSMILMKCH